MFLTTTPDIGQIMADSLRTGIPEAFQTVLKIFWEGLVQCAIDYPLLVIAVAGLVIFNWVYPKFKKRK